MKVYPKQVNEFIRVRMEQTPNNAQIARDVVNKFPDVQAVQDRALDGHRRNISDYRKKLKIRAKMAGIKRLFFDIETTYMIYRRWQYDRERYPNPDKIIEPTKIICISYKWQGDDTVHSLDWRNGEKEMLKAFVKIAGEADELVAHNGNKFDLPFIRTRCIYYGVLMFPNYRTLDTLLKSRGGFAFPSNKLDYLGKYFGIGGKADTSGYDLWVRTYEGVGDYVLNIYNAAKKCKSYDEFVRWYNFGRGDKESLEKMIKYCNRDVVLLEDVFFVLSPFITHNNNFAVLTGGEKWECPECASENVEMFRTYATPLGTIRREMRCNDCKKQYKVSNKTYMAMLQEEMRKK